MTELADRAPLGQFLAGNPFPDRYTGGLFFREKMRAIHRITPEKLGLDGAAPKVLEIGGGRAGMGSMLFPTAEITNVDLDSSLGEDAANRRINFICADACALPFPDDSFDVVTMFDVLEHIEDDRAAAKEAMRVVRPGGAILVSCPDADWRYPHHHFMKPVAQDEAALMAEWGHVRRGYTVEMLEGLFGRPADSRASFIGPATAIYHDIGFSKLPTLLKTLAYSVAAPVALAGYLSDGGQGKGAETAYAWTNWAGH